MSNKKWIEWKIRENNNHITMLRKAKETKLRLIQESNKRLLNENTWEASIEKIVKNAHTQMLSKLREHKVDTSAMKGLVKTSENELIKKLVAQHRKDKAQTEKEDSQFPKSGLSMDSMLNEGHEWRHDIMKTIIDNVSELEMGQDMDTDYVESLIDRTVDKLYELRWKMSGKGD